MISPATTQPIISNGQATSSVCDICGETRRAYLFVIRGLPVVRCPGCGLISLYPQPNRKDYGAFYGKRLGAQDPRLLWTDSATERDAARRTVETLRSTGLTHGRLLLIAPPDHPFAAEARAQGLEIGQHATIADVEEGRLRNNDHDAGVVLYQLDKAGSPLEFLRRVHGSLRPGASLLIATASLDTWPARFFGAQWTEWRPENRYYFNSDTLQSLLLKSGFDQIWVEPEQRMYTLSHIYDRAKAFPHTLLTRTIRFLYHLLPRPLHPARLRLPTSGVLVTARRVEARPRPLCSIVVPAYNEKNTFTTLMDALLAKQIDGMDKEVIVVESNSSDGTREAALGYQNHPEVRLVLEERPRGKGHAVRTGLAHARGDVVLIQDADLEYDLNDYQSLLEPLLNYRAAFVLGSRHGGNWKMRHFSDQPGMSTFLNFGHIFFTTLMNTLYGQRMKDPFTMFKVFRRDCLYGLTFECNRFDFDHELVIKLLRKGYQPVELPVNYQSRSFSEGKKVGLVRDPLSWVWVNFKNRFAPPIRRPVADSNHERSA